MNEELMILITKYGWKNKFNFYYELIYKIYKENYCYNLQNYLENVENDVSMIYTYSSIFLEKNIFEVGIKNKKSGIIFSTRNVVEININEINTKEQIEKEIYEFFNDLDLEQKRTKNLLIFKFREEDLNKLNNIYHLLKNYKYVFSEKQLEVKNKFVLFIIYLKSDEKIKSNSNSILFISNLPQKLIDNLQNNHENFPQILISTNKEIIEKRLFDINNTIITNMNDIFRYFDFEKINYNKQEDAILPFQIKLLKYTINSNSLQTILIKCFIKFIDQEEDFINKIFRKEIFDSENLINMDFMKTFFEYICDLYFQNFRKIVIILEKEQIMTSLLFNEKFCQNEIITKYINDYTDQINNKENIDFKWDDKILNKKYQIQILSGLKFPFVKNIFNHILTYVSKNISSQFLEEDTNFLYRNISIDYLYERQEKYMKNLRKLNNKLYLEVKKYVIVLDILRSKNKELISFIFKKIQN